MLLSIAFGIGYGKRPPLRIAFKVEIDDHAARNQVAAHVRRVGRDTEDVGVLGTDFPRVAQQPE